MLYLLTASVVWALSFGLIKYSLADLDSNFVAWIRLLISFAVFAPFLRLKRIDRRLALNLFVLGAVQYGLMYMSYIYSYRFLAAHQVAMFTIFTPIYVTLINDLYKKRFHRMFLLTAVLAVAGAGVIVCSTGNLRCTLTGLLVLQVSNMCFAFGQVRYKIIMEPGKEIKDSDIFGLMYLGAVVLTSLPACITAGWSQVHLTRIHMLTLLYLGIVPSGICFFLWNVGARKTNAGTLAVFNNAKIPFAVICSLLLFGEKADIPRLLVGGAVILLAVIVNEKYFMKHAAHSIP